MPFGKARDSTSSSAMSGPVSGNSRVPWPTTTGQTSRVISSTSWLSSSQRIRAPLPCTCSSPPCLSFRSAMAAARSSERTDVSHHFGSVSVVEATYLGRVFNAVQLVFFFDDTATTEIYTLSLHDALPFAGRFTSSTNITFQCGGGSVLPLSGSLFGDRKSTRLNSSHVKISYAVFCLK